MKFSISVPVCGQAEYLPTALESIRQQPVEIELAVLDATPDDSVQQVLAGYRDRVRYGYHRPDAGQSAAIQEGWDHTAGEIVAWLNADDYYFPDALAKVERVFRERPDIDVVYGHAVHVSPEGDFQMYFPAISEDISALRRGCTICQPSCFVRRAAMERVGGVRAELHYTMDWDLWLRLYQANSKFYFLDEPLSAVRIYPETKTMSGARRRYQELDRILNANANWLRCTTSLMGFRYYDLLNNKNGFLDHLAYYSLSMLATLRKLGRAPSKASIRGLECWTNAVQEECEVSLPWYRQTHPGTISLLAEKPAQLLLTCGGHAVALRPCGREETDFLGARINAYRYCAEAGPVPGNLLTFRIHSSAGPWRLLSLKVSATP